MLTFVGLTRQLDRHAPLVPLSILHPFQRSLDLHFFWFFFATVEESWAKDDWKGDCWGKCCGSVEVEGKKVPVLRFDSFDVVTLQFTFLVSE